MTPKPNLTGPRGRWRRIVPALTGLCALVLPAAPALADPGTITPSTVYHGNPITYVKGSDRDDFIFQQCSDPANPGTCADIAGTYQPPSVTTTTYTPAASFAGTGVRVRAYRGSAPNAGDQYTSIVTVAHDTVNAGTPSLTGSATVGDTLTAVAGTWTSASGGAPVLSYAWKACDSGGCSPVAGDVSSYAPTDSDVGKTITLTVTGTIDEPFNSGTHTGTASASSAPVAYDTPHPGTVAVSGTGISGTQLTATPSGWTTASGTIAHTYDWYRCTNAAGTSCDATPVQSGASDTYDLHDGDAGKYIKVVDTGDNTHGTATASDTLSPAVMLNSNSSHEPSLTLPSPFVVTKTVTATSNSAWTPTGADLTKHRFIWYRCSASSTDESTCDLVKTETVTSGPYKSTYTLVDADYDNYILVVDAVQKANGTWVADDRVTTRKVTASKALDRVHAGTTPITGTGISGTQLTATPTGWTTGSGTITHTYEWFRCTDDAGTSCDATPIKSGSSATYDLHDGDAGKYIKVVDTGDNTYKSATASDTFAVAIMRDSGPDNAPVLTLPVPFVVGKTVTVASNSAWTPTGADLTTHRFSWYRCATASIDESTCSLVKTDTVSSGPYQSSYTLVDADAGKYILVVDAVKTASGQWVADDVVTTRKVSGSKASTYSQGVIDDGATNYWRLGETGKKVKTGSDQVGGATVYYKGVKFSGDGSIAGDSNGSRKFLGKAYIFANGVAVDDAAYSLEAWAKSASCAKGTVVEHGGNGTLYVNAAGKFAFRGQGTDVVGSACTAGWHHLVGTYDSDTGALTLYVDGAQAQAGTTATEPNGAPTLYIGRGHLAGNWVGSIDEVALYDTALSAAQVAAHYAAATPKNS